ncbi:MAG: endonuclease domain-containing protein [Bacteroidota bacterium]
MTRVFNRVSETPRRKSLRHSMPEAEVILWSKLQRRQVDGLKFRRQYSVGRFVVDFYCTELKLAIEVDGDSHFKPGAEWRDAERETFIKQYGIKFLRFTNSDVRENLYGVLTQIWDTVNLIKSK